MWNKAFFLTLLLVFSSSWALAFPADLPGTWQGEEQGVHFAKTKKVNPDAVPEFVDTTLVLRIDKQKGARFYGTLQRDGVSRTVVGIADAEGNLTLVGDKGTYTGRLTPSGELR